MTYGTRAGGACLVAALLLTVAPTAGAQETFSAKATVKRGLASASAPVTVTVTRFATQAERDAAMKAVKAGGTEALRKALAGLKDAGFIQLGERKTAIKFASERPTAGGRLITVVAAEPILYFGSSLPSAKAKTGFDVAVAILEVKTGGAGLGDLSPAAKVGLDPGGALLIEDYGETVIWLQDVAAAK
jgi:hypothetical protein